jgi:cytochrome c-type biogenesis protein
MGKDYENMGDVSYIVAFGSGLLSFFTPCIIPLLPLYFGYLAGETINSIEDKKIHRKLLINTGAFGRGLTSLNIMLGFGAKAASDLLLRYSNGLRIAGGVLLILFGIYFMFGLSLRFMEKEHKIQMKSYTPSFLKSFLLGITFSFGWTPCNGPIIATILMMASFQKDYLSAGSLMLVYSLGFATMFMLAAVLVGLFMKKVKGVYKYFKWIKIVAGLLMIGMGYLMITNQISLLVF